MKQIKRMKICVEWYKLGEIEPTPDEWTIFLYINTTIHEDSEVML